MDRDLMYLIEKYAARKQGLKTGFSDEDIAHERDLIRRVQENDDRRAMNELVRIHRGTITKSVQKAGLHYVMDNNMAHQYAVGIFKDTIKNNFDLKKNNKPATYLLSTLPLTLEKKKYQFMDIGARKSDELVRKNQYYYTAREMLKRELHRDPTMDEVHDYITKELGLKTDKKELARINQLTRRELSGNEQIGGNTQAEFLTWTDVKNVDNVTPEEVFQNSLMQQRIEAIITDPGNGFTRNERRYIRNYCGLGEFRGRAAKNPNQIIAANGMTYYEARKVLDKLKKKLQASQEE